MLFQQLSKKECLITRQLKNFPKIHSKIYWPCSIWGSLTSDNCHLNFTVLNTVKCTQNLILLFNQLIVLSYYRTFKVRAVELAVQRQQVLDCVTCNADQTNTSRRTFFISNQLLNYSVTKSYGILTYMQCKKLRFK